MFSRSLKLASAIAFVVALVSGAHAASAAIVSVDFDNDTLGSKPAGFSSVDSNILTINSNNGTGSMDVRNNSEGNGTPFLASFYQILRMDFSVGISSISLEFGNDDLCCGGAGDLAIFEAFDNNVFVGRSTLAPNFDDIMNQTISFALAVGQFDQVNFFYGDSLFNPIGLTELVDNIVFDTASPSPVPLPAALPLFGIGLGIMGFIGWRRKRRMAAEAVA